MGTPPGTWQILVPAYDWTLLTSVILAIVGKGKGRFFVLGAADEVDMFWDWALLVLLV